MASFSKNLIAVVGPTGSGKSDLALDLAMSLDGEIVNCDSLQIYRDFNIGAAKLPPAARRGIPHHLMDLAGPDDVFTAGDYARLARDAVDDINARGKVPVIAGGTGFYLSALLHGLAPGPSRDQELRVRLQQREQRRPGSLARLLRRFDPATAARIHPNDVHKLVRALEICLRSRRPASQVFETGRDSLVGYRVLLLGLNPDRSMLYDRLNQRTVRMFETGLLDEVRDLLARGHSQKTKPMGSLGYKQALQHLTGHLTLAEAIASTQVETRHYAKRQWTWFRRDASVQWLAGFGADPAVREQALFRAANFLQGFTQLSGGAC